MWSLWAVLAAAVYSLLLGDFVALQAGGTNAPDNSALASRLRELRNSRTGVEANRIGYVFYDATKALSERKPPFQVVTEKYLEYRMLSWLKSHSCVGPSGRHLAKETALSCACSYQRMWFGWSDDTAWFLYSATELRLLKFNFPLLISLNRNGFTLMSANEFSIQNSSLGCIVDPVPGLWTYSKRRAKDWKLPLSWPSLRSSEIQQTRLSAQGVSNLSHVAQGHASRLQVELADWMGGERRPMGSSLDDAARAQIVGSFLQSQRVSALTISWMPQPEQPKRQHAKTLGVMVSALARPSGGVKYLAISDLDPKAVGLLENKRLLSALYSARGRGDRAPWSKLREFSVTVKSYGLDQKSNSPNLYDELRRLLELMPSLQHVNINVDHPMRPTRSELGKLVGNNRGVSCSIAAGSAFIGIAPAAKLHQFDREGDAILLSLPSIDPSNRDAANGDQVCSVQHIHSGLLRTTAALTLFVKQSVCGNHARQLGRAISSDFSMLERLAIDGRWSDVDVNDVLLQMKPKLPAGVTHALIRPVSLQTNNAKDAIKVLHDMLIDSDVETLALTVKLPRDILGRRLAPYANQLVDTLTGMAHLTRLDLTLSTRADPEAEAAAETIARRIRAKLPFARITHRNLTENWSEPDCRSTEPLAFDAFVSELSDKLKSIARCTPPTLEFPMPHHFSGAFDYRTDGELERLLGDFTLAQADLLGDFTHGREADLLGDITHGQEADLLGDITQGENLLDAHLM